MLSRAGIPSQCEGLQEDEKEGIIYQAYRERMVAAGLQEGEKESFTIDSQKKKQKLAELIGRTLASIL